MEVVDANLNLDTALDGDNDEDYDDDDDDKDDDDGDEDGALADKKSTRYLHIFERNKHERTQNIVYCADVPILGCALIGKLVLD